MCFDELEAFRKYHLPKLIPALCRIDSIGEEVKEELDGTKTKRLEQQRRKHEHAVGHGWRG